MEERSHMIKHALLVGILSGVGAMAALGWLGVGQDDADLTVPCECVTGSGH